MVVGELEKSCLTYQRWKQVASREWKHNQSMGGQLITWWWPTWTKPDGCTILKVKDLMNQDGECWNKWLLLNLFNEAKVQAILSIPINSIGMKDRLVWKFTPNGQFLVKLGYKVAKDKEKKAKGDEGSAQKQKMKESCGGRFGTWI